MKADDLNSEVVLAAQVLNLLANKIFLSLQLLSEVAGIDVAHALTSWAVIQGVCT